jgi:hypothetical protein
LKNIERSHRVTITDVLHILLEIKARCWLYIFG